MVFNFGRTDYNEQFGGTDDPDAEPVFLLRGKDMASARAVRAWVKGAKDYGAQDDILIQANEHATRMQRYAESNEDRRPADLERSGAGEG